ncbi:MAG: isopentenyl phosphate kinase [Candidatus Thorarchaeota archaeon]
MKDIILLKLGGSVITNKHETPPRINNDTVNRIAKELQIATSPLIIVLGGGAHGHQAAYSYGYGESDTPINRLLAGIPKIRHNMNELAFGIETLFNQEGLSSVVISPFSISFLENKQIASFSLESIQRTIDSGHNVITHGDVCFDSHFGAAILSGDTIMAYLAKELKIKEILIGTDVDGVLDSNPSINPHARVIPVINQLNKESVLKAVGPSSATDVTGGMAKKVIDLLALSGLGTETTIFNLNIPGRLEDLLKGESVLCTKIAP